MKLLAITIASLTLYGQGITISHRSSRRSSHGDAESSPGRYALTHCFLPPNRHGLGARVTFEPGARPAWVQQWAAPCRRFARGMWSESPRAGSIGTGEGHHAHDT